MNAAAPVSPEPEPESLPDFPTLLAQLQSAPGALVRGGASDERPLHGQTLYLAQCALDTRFGPFRAYIFQDIIDKHYIIALAHGDITSAPVLHVRLHSSCVTSETLRGADCDCVQQLEGAFRIIAEKGSGILFYLLQEGRGVGYLAKARDRMLVQASLDQLNTFHAYAAMGLKKDHRNYDNIAQICHLLGTRAAFVVLTNNPDKVESLREQGIQVAGTEPLEFEPSPFNLAYLSSKAASGHHLSRVGASVLRRAQPPEPVVPFRPHPLPGARRFIHGASYLLPVKPVDNDILLDQEQFGRLFGPGPFERWTSGPRPVVRGYQVIRGNRFFVRVDPGNLEALRREDPGHPLLELLATPYWFRVHVYYDIVTSQEHVILTHGSPRSYDIPLVRVQSESLFCRFPLRNVDNRDKFKKSVKLIVQYGVGAVVLLYFDGRGAGFGAHATDRMMAEQGQALSSDEAYRKLGVGYDSRDYDATMLLLRHHIPNQRIHMIMNSPSSLVKKKEYAEALNHSGFEVHQWAFLDETAVRETPRAGAPG